MQIGQEVTTIDGKRGKVQHIEQFCAGGKVRECCWVRIHGHVDVSDWGKELPQYLASQLTPVEPEKPKDEGKPCGYHYAICTHCESCEWNHHPETYAQRLAMAWGPEAESNPTQLMICEKAGTKDCGNPRCEHGKRHAPPLWASGRDCTRKPSYKRCHAKCIPYHEERDWFVVSMSKILQGPHLQTWGLQEWEAEALCIGGQRAFSWSQGVRG